MENPARDVNHLPARHRLALLAETHLPRPLHDEIDLLLLLIVPRHLPALQIERDIAHAEILRLDGRHAAGEILGAAARRIAAAGNLRKVGNNHAPKNVRYGFSS